MHKFYEGCFGCEKCSCERCFECSQAMVIKEDWIYSLGFYFSRCSEEHKTSSWSQAIIRLKSNCRNTVSVFGKIIACCMDRHFDNMKPYLITSVPAFPCESLFRDFQNSPMQFLAFSVFSNLKDTKWTKIENVLIQTKPKTRRQHSCSTDMQRLRNIQGVYAVQSPESVKGRNIVLLDDIVTSGATMKECLTTLLQAGAKEVIGLTLARTFRKGEKQWKSRLIVMS